MDHERKGFKVEDVDAEGNVTAQVATLQKVDADGDVTLPGFFGEQATRMVWSHKWDQWIGKGRIYEQGSRALFEGGFFMDTHAGQEAFKSVRGMGDLAEWSYGYNLKADGWSRGEWEGRQVRLLKPTEDNQPGATIDEVSPVLVGAGVDTRTLSLKGATGELSFVDELTLTVAEVKAAIARGQAIAALRAEKGQQLGASSNALLHDLALDLKQLTETLDALAVAPTAEGDPPPVDDPPPPDDEHDAQTLELAHLHAEELLAGLPLTE